LETISATKKQKNLKNGKVRFCLNIDIRKEMEDSRLNAIKQLITFVKGRLNFSCKSTTAANVDLTESLLDKWLKNNHITVDKIYYLCSLFVIFFLQILVFKFYFSTAENRQKNKILWQLTKIRHYLTGVRHYLTGIVRAITNFRKKAIKCMGTSIFFLC